MFALQTSASMKIKETSRLGLLTLDVTAAHTRSVSSHKFGRLLKDSSLLVSHYVQSPKHRNPLARINHRPEDGGSKHLCNAGKLLSDHMSQQPRRKSSSTFILFRLHVSITLCGNCDLARSQYEERRLYFESLCG
jgi:hypothetical protein